MQAWKKPTDLSQFSIISDDFLRSRGIKSGFLAAFAICVFKIKEVDFGLDPPVAIPLTLLKEVGGHTMLYFLGRAAPILIVMVYFDGIRLPCKFV